MIPVDAFAYEILHGVGLCELLFEAVANSATAPMIERYPELDRALAYARNALEGLHQTAEMVWTQEVKKAEPTMHPDGLQAAKNAASKGLCLFCEEPLPPRKKKPRQVCMSVECRRAYDRAWRRDHPRSAA